MSPEQQIDRSVLAGKDRDELHTIAGAIGVKAATRMRKADLIEAILNAANGGESGQPAADANGDQAPAPRRVRSARSSQLADDDPIAALAAEEDALGADGDADEEAPMPRPRARRATPTEAASESAAPEPSAPVAVSDEAPAARDGASDDRAGRRRAGRRR